MLILFIVLYMLLTLAVGVFASRLVQNSKDYLLAGRSLPFHIATFVAFATWFGSETILGASSVMAKEGLWGVVADPFGAALCLILVGLFFAKPLYRMNLITFGDFYRVRYGRKTEIVASIMLIASYFGWIGAQMVAIGIILHITTGIPQSFGILLGSLIVLIYTFLGGMWAVSLTDFIQSIMIVVGLLVVLYEVSNGFSEISPVVMSQPPEYYKFFPSADLHEVLLFIIALISIGLGSIPQQDVFQRVMSSRSERVAVLSSITAGFLYLAFASIPLTLAIFARVKYPNLLDVDPQLMLPTMIMEHTSQITKVFFFGALLSAIMSTASGAILAPAAVLSENLLRPLFPNLSDRGFLMLTRLSVVFVAGVSLLFAFGGESIFQLVVSSSALSLVSLFVPMVGALYFNVSDQRSAIASMICGFSVWVVMEYVLEHEYALLVGLGTSFLVFVLSAKLGKSKRVSQD
ncbi:sodium:solute symporter family protein [Thermocrinis sp.]